MKAKVGELEDEVRGGFYSHLSKEFTGVVQGVSGKRRLLMRFQYVCDKYMTSNQLTFVTVDYSPVNKESEVTMIAVIRDEIMYLEKG